MCCAGSRRLFFVSDHPGSDAGLDVGGWRRRWSVPSCPSRRIIDFVSGEVADQELKTDAVNNRRAATQSCGTDCSESKVK
jgi:hypothetical protein